MFNRNRKSGFTLLELLIVVIIVSILAAVALFLFRKMIWGARSSEAANTVGSILTAETLYYHENSSFIAGTLPIAALLLEVNTINYTYVVTTNGTVSTTVTATGAAGSNTAGITVTGTVKNDGSRTALITTIQSMLPPPPPPPGC